MTSPGLCCWSGLEIEQSLSFLHPLILPWGHSHDFAEEAGEVVGVFDADLVADLVYFHVGEVEQLTGLLDLQLVEVGQGSVAGALAEEGGEVGGGVTGVVGDLLECQSLLDVLLHQVDGGGDDVVRLRVVAGGVAVLLEVT